MQVSHETIYQSLYVQGRGALRRELARSLRTGRALRKPRRRCCNDPLSPSRPNEVKVQVHVWRCSSSDIPVTTSTVPSKTPAAPLS